jgi:hypothetical protein
MKITEIVKSIWGDVNAMLAVKTIAAFIAIAILTITVTAIFFNLLFPELTQGLAIRITRVSMYLVIAWAWDRFAIGEVNTIEELRKGNTAYAIFISSFNLGLAFICASI